jgi:hypothetical protein
MLAFSDKTKPLDSNVKMVDQRYKDVAYLE